MLSIYLTPALDLAQFLRRLDDIGGCVRRHFFLQRPVLATGNFNAKSPLWGSPRLDNKGEVLAERAAELSLCILNIGTRSTYVRLQGESIVDLTWADPSSARLIKKWRVLVDTESFSDHRYLEMVATPTLREVLARRQKTRGRTRRWALKKMDENALETSILAAVWAREGGEEGNTSLKEEIQWIGGVIFDACKALILLVAPLLSESCILVDGGNSQIPAFLCPHEQGPR